jgi:hypothetical protein
MAAKRYGPRLAASFAVFAVLGTAAGCSHSPTAQTTTTTKIRPGTPSDPVAPSIYSVGRDRFVESVEVGGKVLEITPPPKLAAPLVTSEQAQMMFDAYDAFSGIYKFDLLGLGDATLEQTAVRTTSFTMPAPPGARADEQHSTSTTTRVGTTTSTTIAHPTTTTTRPPPSTTTTTAPPPSTTTTTPPPPPTTSAVPVTTPTEASSTTTPTTAPTTTTTAPPPQLYDKTLAWVGIAVAQNPGCAKGSPATVAVVIDADTGRNVVAVETGSCGATSPVVTTDPVELESVPWSPVGAASTAIVVNVPACGSYVGWTELTIGNNVETQVEAAVPYEPQCPGLGLGATQKVVDLVVPLDGGQSVPHAPTGPVDNLEVL